jgi:hypothetical protein
MARILMKPRTLTLKGTVSEFRDIKCLGHINLVWKNDKGISTLFRKFSGDTKTLGLKFVPSEKSAGAPTYGTNQIRIDTHTRNSINQVDCSCNSVFTQKNETSLSVRSYRLGRHFERTGLNIGFSKAGITISKWTLSRSHRAKPGTLIKQFIKQQDPLLAIKIIFNLVEGNHAYQFMLRKGIGREYQNSLIGFPIYMGGITSGWRYDLENNNHELKVPVNVKRLEIKA